MAFDWAAMRAEMIKVHGIRRADDKFAFFYDETNNISKFLPNVRVPALCPNS